jgi:hypothetical protein
LYGKRLKRLLFFTCFFPTVGVLAAIDLLKLFGKYLH